MSRPASRTGTSVVDIVSFSGMTGSIASASTNPPSNAFKSSGNTSAYAIFSGTSSSASGYAYYNFDQLSIPLDATINSVSCVAVGRVSNASRCYAAFQLMAGNTAKGSATNFKTTTVSACTLTTGTWTASELQNIALRITVRRAGSSAGSARFFGATLSVNYTINGVEYEVTVANSTTITTEPTGTTYVFQGDKQNVEINASNLSSLNITDNGTSIIGSLTLVPSGTTTLDTIPTTFIGFSGNSVLYAERGLDNSASTDYSILYLRNSPTNGAYMVYKFNTDDLPQQAVIESVSCNVKVSFNVTSSSITQKSVQLYAGNTAKGSAYTNFTNSTAISNCELTTGTWTRNELSDARVRAGAYYNGSNSYYMYFYGATLSVRYRIDSAYYLYTISGIAADHTITIQEKQSGVPLYIKQNGSWTQLNKVYKKVNGSWVEQTDLTNVFDPNQIYVRN